MDEREIRLRCIEAAARAPIAHQDGPAAGVRETASAWFDWIISAQKAPGSDSTLRLPPKKTP